MLLKVVRLEAFIQGMNVGRERRNSKMEPRGAPIFRQ